VAVLCLYIAFISHSRLPFSTAAGWSSVPFQKDDPLAADYIDYLLASPDTPQPVKSELAGLSANPAFKRAGSQ
jgi:hypothetical protein